MKILLSPVLSYSALSVYVIGDIITINGTPFDFSKLPEGASLSAKAIESDHFAGPVSRTDGELSIILRLPHPPNASEACRFPQSVQVIQDGPVELPT